MNHIPTYETGLEYTPEFCDVPMVDLLFRTYQMLFYVQPSLERAGGMDFFVMDDFGNCRRVALSQTRVYHRS